MTTTADQFRERAIEARKGVQGVNSEDWSIRYDIIEESLQIQSVLYEVGAAILDALAANEVRGARDD